MEQPPDHEFADRHKFVLDFTKLFMASSKTVGNGTRSLLELSDVLDFHYLKRIMVYSNLRQREK